MADRIEYQGDPLPSGLPGFGGGSVEVLTLPGINSVVVPLKFGPTVEAVNAVPPDPTPPTGSDPKDPTDAVVAPGPAPTTPNLGGNYCSVCEPPTSNDQGNPILFATIKQSSCTNCQGTRYAEMTWFDGAHDETGQGVFWGNSEVLRGVAIPGEWEIRYDRIYLTNNLGKLDYAPKEIQVCVDGEVKTWYVLAWAYEPGDYESEA